MVIIINNVSHYLDNGASLWVNGMLLVMTKYAHQKSFLLLLLSCHSYMTSLLWKKLRNVSVVTSQYNGGQWGSMLFRYQHYSFVFC